jgi:hypothetical protein
MPRNLKHRKPVRRRSISIREDQDNYLEGLRNVSEWIRDAIDEKIASEERPDDLLALTSKIEALQKRRSEIFDSESYQLADDARGFKECMGSMEKEESLVPFKENGDILAMLFVGGDIRTYYLPLNEVAFRTFVKKHSLKARDDGKYLLEGEPLADFVKLVRRSWQYYVTVSDGFNKELREIETEIARLRDQIIHHLSI